MKAGSAKARDKKHDKKGSVELDCGKRVDLLQSYVLKSQSRATSARLSHVRESLLEIDGRVRHMLKTNAKGKGMLH